MGQGAFLTRGLEKMRAEFSLRALVYNLRRALNISGLRRSYETQESRVSFERRFRGISDQFISRRVSQKGSRPCENSERFARIGSAHALAAHFENECGIWVRARLSPSERAFVALRSLSGEFSPRSGGHGRHHRLDADDVERAPQIVGKRGQAELGAHPPGAIRCFPIRRRARAWPGDRNSSTRLRNSTRATSWSSPNGIAPRARCGTACRSSRP